jgi:hypothetical protein
MMNEPRPICDFCNISLADDRKILLLPTNPEEILSLKNFKLLIYFLKKPTCTTKCKHLQINYFSVGSLINNLKKNKTHTLYYYKCGYTSIHKSI